MPSSPRARSLLSLILGLTVILGAWTGAGYALLSLLDDALPDDGAFAALVVALVPLGIALVAVATSGGETGDETWDAVGQTARVVALLALGVVLLTLLAGVVEQSPFGYAGVF